MSKRLPHNPSARLTAQSRCGFALARPRGWSQDK